MGLLSNGTVVCWGSNNKGPCIPSSPPLRMRCVAMAAGYHHSVAMLSNGDVVCWGNNDKGQSTPPFS